MKLCYESTKHVQTCSGKVRWTGISTYNQVGRYQSVLVGVVDHPALLHHVAAFPLCVFDRLNDSHKWDVVTGGRAARAGTTHNLRSLCVKVFTVHVCVCVFLYLMARLDSSRSGSCRSQKSLGPASSSSPPSDVNASSMSSNSPPPLSISWSSRQPSTMTTSDSAPRLRSSTGQNKTVWICEDQMF